MLAQTILISTVFSIVIDVLRVGSYLATDIFVIIEVNQEVVSMGAFYMHLTFEANIVAMLLFLINRIFRGTGDASMGMHSLRIVIVYNIIWCSTLI